MERKFKIALFYYTQTGQALDIAQKICEPMADAGCEIVSKEIVPEKPFPFPWSLMIFLQAFPESRLGIACPIKPIELDDVADCDMVIIAGQSWYLSLSMPLHGFFQESYIRDFLNGRKVVFVNGCRNMCTMAQKKTREYLRECGAHYEGFIELQDRTSNLVSAVTIARWLIFGKKNATAILPAAGVSQRDIEQASRFGITLLDTLKKDSFETLQSRLVDEGAVTFKSNLYFIERNGYKMWGWWARLVAKKGGYMDARRTPYLIMFCIYMVFVLFIVSPFALIFHYTTYPFRKASFDRAKRELCYELS